MRGKQRLHLDLDTQHTLTEENVADSIVNKVASGLTRVDHESIGELHRFGTSSTELARNDNLTTLGTRLHDETQDTIASTRSKLIRCGTEMRGKIVDSPTDGKTTQQFVAQALALCDGRETTVLDLFGVKFERVFGELESLLDERSELADATTLLTKDFLGVGGPDDDLSRRSISAMRHRCWW